MSEFAAFNISRKLEEKHIRNTVFVSREHLRTNFSILGWNDIILPFYALRYAFVTSFGFYGYKSDKFLICFLFLLKIYFGVLSSTHNLYFRAEIRTLM